jgi:hypothetical protein
VKPRYSKVFSVLAPVAEVVDARVSKPSTPHPVGLRGTLWARNNPPDMGLFGVARRCGPLQCGGHAQLALSERCQREAADMSRLQGRLDMDPQDEGEQDRQAAGIDGTMGDAQDVPHEFKPSTLHGACRMCGLAISARVHR